MNYKKAGILLVLFLFIAVLTYHITPGYDWQHFFRPSALAALQGKSPYIAGVYNPPWLLVITIPFALLPEPVGGRFFSIAGAAAFFWAVLRFRVKMPETVMFFLSPLVISAINIGNIDGWVALGMTLPPWAGLFLVLLKPQVGLGIVIYWLVDCLRTGGLKKALRVFAPVTLALFVSVAIFGIYFDQSGSLVGTSMNVSIWPWGFFAGIVFLGIAIYKQRSEPAILSGAFFSPYVGVASLSVILFSLLHDRRNSLFIFLSILAIFVFMMISGVRL